MDAEFLEHLKSQWMGMIDALEDPLVLIDQNYNIRRQNRAYVDKAANPNQLGLREFKGKKCFEEFAGRNAPCRDCKLIAAQKDGYRTTWSSKELFEGHVYEVRALPNIDVNDGEALIAVHYRDVTQQLALQESLARADKLTALGKLAGGVAHEINSPLAGIMAFAQMALREMQADDPHRDDMKEIESAAQKCKVIVEGLLGFARQDAPETVDVYDIVESVKSTLRLARVMVLKEQIDLRVNLPTHKIYIEGSRGRIAQVLLNLITNAIAALKDGGGELEISIAESHDEEVIMTVRDSGVGIPEKNLKRIFDPFFTTKPVGEGTGLGLAISYSIVTQHRGQISVESTVGVGTTFIVRLPKAQPPHERGES